MKSFQIKAMLLSSMILSLCLGCASLKETARGILGVSTNELMASRKDAMVKTFDLDYMSCDARVRKAIKIMKSYIYDEDKKNNLIAIYVTERDTTPVGIFITKVSPTQTKVEVSSQSSFARDMIATKIFGYIQDKDSLKSEGPEEEAKPLISL